MTLSTALATKALAQRTPIGRPVVRRAVVGVVLALGFLGSFAQAALADSADPTNYESTVLDVEPRTEGVRFEVIGGDAFLAVSVEQGHEVTIPGYFDEPYIRVDGDGSVFVNHNSEAFFINQDRYGEVSVPNNVDGSGEPVWVLAADDGQYAWHDHRTHWMSEDLPPTVTGTDRQQVFPWAIPAVVDTAQIIVSGELLWIPSLNPIPALMAGSFALLPLFVWKPGRTKLLGAWVTVGGGLALAVTVAQELGAPSGHRAFPAISGLAACVIAVGLTATTRRQLRHGLRPVMVTVAAILLGGWAILTADILWMPVVPSSLSPITQRAFVGGVWWIALCVATLAVITMWDGSRLGTTSAPFENRRLLGEKTVTRAVRVDFAYPSEQISKTTVSSVQVPTRHTQTQQALSLLNTREREK